MTPSLATTIGHLELRLIPQQVLFVAGDVWQRRVEDVQDKRTSVDEVVVNATETVHLVFDR